jgi:hypothetical protein
LLSKSEREKFNDVQIGDERFFLSDKEIFIIIRR